MRLTPIRQARFEQGLLQYQVANLLGIPAPLLSDFELGKKPIPKDLLMKLAAIYKMPEKELSGNGG